MNDKCNEPIEYAVPWASDILHICKYHAVAFLKIGAVIGSPIQNVDRVLTGGLCQQPDKWSDEDKISIDKQLTEVLGNI